MMEDKPLSRDYPRSLYLKGWDDLSLEKIVRSAEEEEAARAHGYKKLTEFPHPDTFGAVDPPVEPKPDRMAAARAAKAAKNAGK